MRSTLQNLFTSEVIRDFWASTRLTRDVDSLDPREARLMRIAEIVYHETRSAAPDSS